jgi:hypothetical protein
MPPAFAREVRVVLATKVEPNPAEGLYRDPHETKIVLEKTGWSYQVSIGGRSGYPVICLLLWVGWVLVHTEHLHAADVRFGSCYSRPLAMWLAVVKVIPTGLWLRQTSYHAVLEEVWGPNADKLQNIYSILSFAGLPSCPGPFP